MRSRLLPTVLSALLLTTVLARLWRRGLEGEPEDPRRRHPRLLGDVEEGAGEVHRPRPASPSRSQPHGDAGQLTNKLVLTKDSPLADGVYGIDNTFASRAVDEGVLAPYAAEGAAVLGRAVPLDRRDGRRAHPGRLRRRLRQRRRHLVRASKKLDPAAHARRPDQAGVQGPVRHARRHHAPRRGSPSCSPRSRKYGDGWQDYWKQLMANGTKITAGWSDAYEVDFTAGGGNGDRPIVLSYSSSPPFTIPKGGTRPTTSALLDTCFRQVEYAGVLKGSRQPRGREGVHRLHARAGLPGGAAGQHVRLSRSTPASTLPADWATYAKIAPKPLRRRRRPRSPRTATTWLREWSDLTSR